MENEIELKIMLLPENIAVVSDWLNQQNIFTQDKDILANTYYDSPELFFAKHKMGLRVRSKNNQHEMTLKMKGEIVGGLHIRPEYNLDLPNNQPDFKRLVSHFNLQIENSDTLADNLIPTFSTDFTRHKWLIKYQNSQIEIALDQGLVKNDAGEEAICEVEFELKQGELSDLIQLLEKMPKTNGMWLSSLSKAQRGYLVGKPQVIAKEIEKLTACNVETLSEVDKYQLAQQVADFIRLEGNPKLVDLYQQLDPQFNSLQAMDYLVSSDYLINNIQHIKAFYLK
ncbi:adenylate cyclase [Pasteurellaceae bacterium 15-036681]|nr:adenylate cyclase [Pasteurellaceae bacterium 15-036681]